MASTFEFRKRSEGVWDVFKNDKFLGVAKKQSAWTVRGSHIYWQASVKGRVLGRAETRNGAAELLDYPA